MPQTQVTVVEPWELLFLKTLPEPKRIEYNGGLYSVKLQNTFQDKMGRILAIWVIDQFLRPTLEEEAKQLRRTALYQRRNGHLDMARWYEELAHATEREYPQGERQSFFGLIGDGL
jgi:hypothetical protein